MIVSGGRWEATSSSVRGSAHERDGRPNQDSVRVVDVGGSAPGLVAAVCDGHGGDRYVRSDVGSRFGTEVACEVGRRFLAAFGDSSDLLELGSRIRERVVAPIVARWGERVMDDVMARPFADDERTRARTRANLDDEPKISYGCTLVLAIAGPNWVALVQIGDGDITAVDGSQARAPMPVDDRLVGGETTSLCLPTAVGDARIEMLGEPLPEILLLTSDGYANSFASPTWRSDIATDLGRQLDDFGLEHAETHLPAWLSESARAGGDDVSMALIRRRDADAAPAAVGAAMRSQSELLVHPRSGASISGLQRPHRSRTAWLAALPALIIGLGGGWVLGHSGRDVTDPPSASTALDPTSAPETEPTPTTVASPPATAPSATPASTVPVSSAPTATDAPALDPSGQPVALGGTAGVAWVLWFDPSVPQPSSGEVTFVQEVRSSQPALPLRLTALWRFDGAQLCFASLPCFPAIGVLWPGESPSEPDLVWATDLRVLRSFDPASGDLLGCAVVIGSTNESGGAESDPLVPQVTTPATEPGGDQPEASAPENTTPADGGPVTCEPVPTDITTPALITAPLEENG